MTENRPVALVTGASRGAGRGIAIALGRHGCTVYVTGRTQQSGEAPTLGSEQLSGTIFETAAAVTEAGGEGIPVRCDHSDVEDIRALLDRIGEEQGRLDILVNNAFPNFEEMTQPGNFWEKPVGLMDMLDVGVKGAYAASHFAAPLMVAQGKGLVVFTSSSGAAHYIFGPVYGAHKVSIDKFAADMAVDFRDFGVASVSIWMGTVLTERLQKMIDHEPEKYAGLRDSAETPEFTGEVIWGLYSDPALMEKSGKTLIGAELAREYGITDKDGRQPTSYRETHGVWPLEQFPLVIR